MTHKHITERGSLVYTDPHQIPIMPWPESVRHADWDLEHLNPVSFARLGGSDLDDVIEMCRISNLAMADRVRMKAQADPSNAVTLLARYMEEEGVRMQKARELFAHLMAREASAEEAAFVERRGNAVLEEWRLVLANACDDVLAYAEQAGMFAHHSPQKEKNLEALRTTIAGLRETDVETVNGLDQSKSRLWTAATMRDRKALFAKSFAGELKGTMEARGRARALQTFSDDNAMDLDTAEAFWKAGVGALPLVPAMEREARNLFFQTTFLTREWSWDEACDFVAKSFGAADPRLERIVRQALKDREVHAASAHHRPGFVESDETALVHVSFDGRWEDVVVLAHEMGHKVHATLAQKDEDGSVAARVACETMAELGQQWLYRYALKQAPKEERDLVREYFDLTQALHFTRQRTMSSIGEYWYRLAQNDDLDWAAIVGAYPIASTRPIGSMAYLSSHATSRDHEMLRYPMAYLLGHEAARRAAADPAYAHQLLGWLTDGTQHDMQALIEKIFQGETMTKPEPWMAAISRFLPASEAWKQAVQPAMERPAVGISR